MRASKVKDLNSNEDNKIAEKVEHWYEKLS